MSNLRTSHPDRFVYATLLLLAVLVPVLNLGLGPATTLHVST